MVVSHRRWQCLSSANVLNQSGSQNKNVSPAGVKPGTPHEPDHFNAVIV